MEQSFDYGEHTPKAPANAILEISRMVDESGHLKSLIATHTKELESYQADYDKLVEQDIPNKMKMCGLEELTTSGGYKVTIAKDLFASIPSPTTINKERDPVKRQHLIERRLACFEWLEKHEHSDIINREITIKLGKDTQDAAKDLVERLRSEDGYHVDETVDVHHSTLRSLFKQLRKEKQDVPVELFAVFDQSVAKVSTK